MWEKLFGTILLGGPGAIIGILVVVILYLWNDGKNLRKEVEELRKAKDLLSEETRQTQEAMLNRFYDSRDQIKDMVNELRIVMIKIEDKL